MQVFSNDVLMIQYVISDMVKIHETAIFRKTFK